MITTILDQLRRNRDFMQNVVAWEKQPPRPAKTATLSQPLLPDVDRMLHARGLLPLYTHQVQAIEAIRRGDHLILATPTASGKSLAYTIPVLERLQQRPSHRALYLFPTKALAHDQQAETAALINAGQMAVPVHSYDGDTPQSRRRQVRQAQGILITNPDMLHAGILPYHTGWRDLFSNLAYIVLDEVHTYRGVFGSHVANLLRRLLRICEFYGSRPQFICCSATIANPQEHAERLTGLPFTLIDEHHNGAPSGEKHIILYNPPIVNEELGLRGSSILAAKDAAVTFLRAGIQTILFGRTRQTVELLLAYLQDELRYLGQDETAVTGYRGGYLPLERRDIETGLRSGQIRGVVATNALELGIDIGQLDAAILTGYPGSIAATWQQAGRAGRRTGQSVAMLIASNNPLDQYICHHPRYLFGQSPEHALINPNNLRIMVKHLQCAAFELPFQRGEPYGSLGDVDDLLAALQEAGLLHQTRQQYHYLGEGTPAGQISLRTSGDDTVLIHELDPAGQEPVRVIGEVDLESVPFLLYEEAIYMHQAATFLVETLDWDGRMAYVRPVMVDYYTRASVGSHIRSLRPQAEADAYGMRRAWGEVSVVTQATGYRKIKRYTHETLGFGDIDLPEIMLETDGYWLIFSETLAEQLYDAGILLRPNDYGPDWQQQRQLALARDSHQCRTCGAMEGVLHVHHIRPFREYNYIPGQNDHYRQANQLDNLVTLCPACHRRAEAGQQSRSALGGLAYVLRNLAPLYLMCDPGDIQVLAESRSPLTQAPTVVVYEKVAAGVGFSQRLFDLHGELLAAAQELVATCRCRDGCPACVGPPGEIGPNTKAVTQQLLAVINGNRETDN
jgi:DEAD/DEAH box helicase domain-containing protein